MAGPASSKRQKSADSGSQAPNGSYPPQGGPYGGQFPQGPYSGAPPGGQQFAMNAGYNNMWPPGQQPPYGSQGPWPNGQQGMYRQSPPLGGPNPSWGGGAYRGQGPPPTQSGGGGGQAPGRRGGKQGSSKKSKKNASGSPPSAGVPYQQGWQQQQFPMQNQWGGGGPPPQMWQGGPGGPPPRPSPPPGAMPGQPMVPVNQNWSGGNQSSPPQRSSKKGRPRSSPESLTGTSFPQGGMMPGLPSDVLCTPIGMDPIGGDIFMTSTGVGPGPDDDSSTRKPSGGSSVASREKGRGSYRCGRCGVPKKGHVCPYQPKLKRRPDEPPPEMRNAAVQVEMDEFMTLRRLNLEIQGYPESYATASHMMENRVIGEAHPYSVGGDGTVLSHMGYMGNEPMPGMGQPLSIPTHVSSQAPGPAPMKAESNGDVPSTEDKKTTTTEPMVEDPVDEVPVVEKEKTVAV